MRMSFDPITGQFHEAPPLDLGTTPPPDGRSEATFASECMTRGRTVAVIARRRIGPPVVPVTVLPPTPEPVPDRLRAIVNRIALVTSLAGFALAAYAYLSQ